MPADKGVFEKFLNPVFIETGMWEGNGIQAALNAGFKRVISMDIADKPLDHCTKRFFGNPSVSLWKGDSVEILPNILSTVSDPVTFWLDAHCSGDWGGTGPNPILAELDTILSDWSMPRGTTILIDDWRLFENGEFGEDTVDAICLILFGYSFDNKRPLTLHFADGYQEHTGRTFKSDILVAQF